MVAGFFRTEVLLDMTHTHDASEGRDRIQTEAVPDNGMLYMCPLCLEEGFRPSLIVHRPECVRLTR